VVLQSFLASETIDSFVPVNKGGACGGQAYFAMSRSGCDRIGLAVEDGRAVTVGIRLFVACKLGNDARGACGRAGK
jgi:hypothetical protein